MLQSKNLILALLYQLLCVDAGFTYDWTNWIILPGNLRTNAAIGGDLEGLSGLHINRSELMRNYLDHRQTEPYIMSVRGGGRRKSYRQKKTENKFDDHASDDLVVPLGRAIETVKNFCAIVSDFFYEDNDLVNEGRASTASTARKIKKVKKKYKKFLLPLLIAYKLKFLTLIPVLIGGLILLVGTTGLAGFFFALFTAVMSLKSENKFEMKKW